MTREGTTRRRFLRGTGGAVVGGALLYGSSQSALAQSDEAWPQLGYNSAKTGYAPDNTGPVADISEQWTFETDDEVKTSPVVADGTVYIGSGGKVYALDAGDGTEQWSVKKGDVVSSPAVVDGTVYFGSIDSKVYALDAGDGTEQWSFQTNNQVSTPTVVDGTVYVGSNASEIADGGKVYALDAEDGTEQWSFQLSRIQNTPLAVTNGTVYVGSHEQELHALDAAEGTQQWTFKKDGVPETLPAVVDGTVYTGWLDGHLYRLDAADGTEQWSFYIGGDVRSLAVADGTVYVGSHSDETGMYAADAGDGTQEWFFAMDGIPATSPAVVDGTVYVGNGKGKVYALDAVDGTEQWSFQTGGDWISSAPAVVNDTVYIGSSNHFVYALTSGPPSPTPSPTPEPRDTMTTDYAVGNQNDMPVLPMILGALGVGGVGAWWYRRRGDSSTGGGRPSDSGSTGGTAGSSSTETPSMDWSPGTPSSSDSGSSSGPTSTATSDTTSTSSESDTEPSPDSGLLERVNRLLDEGDDLRDEASDYRDAGEYDRALNTYEKAQDEYEDALETANKSNLIDTDEIEQKLAAVEEARQETHHQRLQERVESVKSNLDHADSLADGGDLEEAQERLEDLKARLLSAKETATQHNFDHLRDEITALEQRRKKRLSAVSERLQAHPIPDEIPRAPEVSVDYDALTDEEPIGGGGNADVSKVTLPTPDGDVTLAIKRPRMAGTLHADAVERMLDEAETWDKLDDHDHIVGVVDYGSEPMPWIAMEYMDGGHLGEQNDEMEISQALWTALAVTKGVYHAHRRGIAHLDLKPQNVLFRTVADAWDVPKVADWGLSKHLLEHSKSVEGMSPQYAAPEQFEEEYGPADNVTDVYQLGAVFYELFTGQPPFEGRPTQVMRAVMDKQPTPPSEIADVPDELDEILLTALAKQKDDRYEDALYLRDDLQEVFDDL